MVDVVLWVVQVALAVFVLLLWRSILRVNAARQAAGIAAPSERFGRGFVVGGSMVVVAAATCLVLPGVVGVATALTPVAAAVVAGGMTIGSLQEIGRSPGWQVAVALLLGTGIPALLAWARLGPYPL